MKFSNILTLAHVSAVLSCATPVQRTNCSGMTMGSDAPSDPATLGYSINHFSLNVRNLTESLAFYQAVLGLRHIFTVQPTPRLSIAYLGHAHGGKNGTGHQTAAELLREKNNAQGLVEMIFLDVPRHDIATASERTNGVGHIGVVVPDVEATQKRLEALGNVSILKRVGEDTPRTGPLAISQGFSEEVYKQVPREEQKAIEAMLDEGNRRFIYAQDPDGNILEIQPQY